MVMFEKPEGKYQPTVDKRTQLTGKAGPEKSKREDDNPESTADDTCFVTDKRFNDLFSLVGQLVKNSNLQNENQGLGRRGDRDRGYYKERDPNRRQGGGDRNSKVVIMMNHVSMRILQLFRVGDRKVGKGI